MKVELFADTMTNSFEQGIPKWESLCVLNAGDLCILNAGGPVLPHSSRSLTISSGGKR
jgi:hypothetical protein